MLGKLFLSRSAFFLNTRSLSYRNTFWSPLTCCACVHITTPHTSLSECHSLTIFVRKNLFVNCEIFLDDPLSIFYCRYQFEFENFQHLAMLKVKSIKAKIKKAVSCCHDHLFPILTIDKIVRFIFSSNTSSPLRYTSFFHFIQKSSSCFSFRIFDKFCWFLWYPVILDSPPHDSIPTVVPFLCARGKIVPYGLDLLTLLILIILCSRCTDLIRFSWILKSCSKYNFNSQTFNS
jgi:hypothetical protein